MEPKGNVHVIGLTPREQHSLRLVLSNLVAGLIDKSIQDATGNESATESAARSSKSITIFMKYNELSDLLCPGSMLAQGRPKVLLVQPLLMKYLVAAVNGYDPTSNYLNAEQVQILSKTFEFLKNKVLTVNQFTYSPEEIEKAKEE
jgi:hypothetical protein